MGRVSFSDPTHYLVNLNGQIVTSGPSSQYDYIGPKNSVEYSMDGNYNITSYEATYEGIWHAIVPLSNRVTGFELLKSLRVSFSTLVESFAPRWPNAVFGSHTGVLACRIYATDPSGESTPPNNAIGYKSKNIDFGAGWTSGVIDIDISGGTAVESLWLWVGVYSSQPIGYYQQDYAIYSDDCIRAEDVTGTYGEGDLSFRIIESSVETGDYINFIIENQNAKQLTMVFKYGNSPFSTTYISAESKSVRTFRLRALKHWFDTVNVTDLKQITVSVTLTDGTRTATAQAFILVAGSDMKPVIEGGPTGTLQFEASVDSEIASSVRRTGKGIAGFTRRLVQVWVSFPTDAGFASATLSKEGGSPVQMSYSSSSGKCEGVSEILTGGYLYVTVTDVRGMSTTVPVTPTPLLPYRKPNFTLDTLYRCNYEGTETPGGDSCAVQVTADYDSSITGNMLRLLTAAVKYSQSYGEENPLISGVQDIFGGFYDPDTAYTVSISIQDKVSGIIRREFMLPGQHLDVQIAYINGHTHVGIGMAPVSSINGTDLNYDTIQLPAGGKIIIGGVSIN